MGPPRPMMPPNRRPNPIRDRKPIVPPQTSLQRQAVTTAAMKAGGRPPKATCKNPDCTTPDVIEGICHSCGLVMDDSNIVSEITFGESSSGAAVVHGSFVGEDQGAARSMGTAFRRAGGSENRENTINEGRRLIEGLGHQLGVVEFTRTVGLQIFKLAAMNNFIQGRRMDMVAAVCLYSACRKADRCRVMLIDFADKIQVNVFKLGRTFKALHRAITIAKDGIMPILPEDLIWRFASLLDFDTFTNKVADDAIRMAQRMSLDWMLMGRRPSGVCGACLILAARMNNFRRTVTEVVYVVKVTTATIQKRLEEFKLTPTSCLTVDEFVNNEFLESAHDPPSFYEKTEEFQKSKKQRKRKRMQSDDEDGDENEEEDESEPNPNKFQKIGTATDLVDQDQAFTTALVSTPVLSFDANGFPISIDPIHSEEVPIDPQLMDEVIADQSKTSFEQLVKEFGDVGTLPEEDVDEEEEEVEEEEEEEGDDDDGEAKNDGSTLASGAVPKRGRPKTKNQAVHVPPEWAATEMTMEEEITEMINDPNTITHATQYAKARRLAAAHVLLAEKANPQKEVSMDVHVGEDEFAQDPEVQNCLLSPADVAMKEKVWINANKDWLRKQQLKEWNKKQAANDPPKAKRNRKKKPRMGEGQTSAANSPAEAAISVLKQRSFSKKINYDAINGLFADIDKMAVKKGDDIGSNENSRASSQITELKKQEPSDLSRISSPICEDNKQSMIDPSLAGGLLLPKKISSRSSASANAARNQRRAEQQARKAEEIPTAFSVSVKESTTLASSQKFEDDDYVGPGTTKDSTTFEGPVEDGELESDWKFQLNAAHNSNDFNNSDDIDDEEDDYGDWKADPDPFIDDDLGARGFESDDNVDDYDE